MNVASLFGSPPGRAGPLQLAQVQAFLEVAEFGSLTRAADALCITQPAITARIHGLEDELGEALFIRTPRGMRLSDAGRLLRPYAERALQVLDAGRHALADAHSARAGRLVVGAAPAVSTYVLPAVLKRFMGHHPQVEVAVRTGHSEQILAMVLEDSIQLGLVRALNHPGVESTHVYQDTLVLVCASHHPFVRRGTVEMADVGRERLILFDRTSSYYELTQTLFLRAGVVAHAIMELDNAEAAKKMVEEGLGVALLPRVAVAREIGTRQLVHIEIADAPPIQRWVDAIRRKDAGPAVGILAAFITELQSTLRSGQRRDVVQVAI